MRLLWGMVVCLGLLAGCGGDDAVCGVAFEGPPTCDDLFQALSTAQEQALGCTRHDACYVSNDPLCQDDGGGYPLVGSAEQDGEPADCLVEAYRDAGCAGLACDWWAPIPKAACLAGVCTQLKTGCETDDDCGPDQVCLTDEESSWPTTTYCDLAP